VRPRWPRPSIRLRLTLVYAVVLVVACAGLLALNYVLLYRSLYRDIDAPSRSDMAALASDPPPGVPAKENDKVRAYFSEEARTDQLRADTLVDTAGTSAVALAVTALVGLGACWLVAGRVLRPLRTLTATTRRISSDRLHERVALAGPRDELRELAATFDEMVARLEASFASQRRFVADASHELRTPLAVIRTGAEVMLAKPQGTVDDWQAMAHRALTATGRAERLLDALLALARSDSGVIVREPHDLAAVAATAVSESDDEADRAGVEVTTNLRPVQVEGDAVLLDRLVRNLVDNAIRHNRRDGRVTVTTGRVGAHAVVTVDNTGDVIPADAVERLFEPFQRLAAHRPAGARSTGLGLAIVRSIVRVHAGTVTATPNADGGLTVTVSLPVSGSDAARRP
jgi:signal transduction histidine kinase